MLTLRNLLSIAVSLLNSFLAVKWTMQRQELQN
uniref:Uncharacterized protein n=1 Tax=Anguilla anguilla TaxID=7936 RepID=A0A0E9RKG9_ANGAN